MLTSFLLSHAFAYCSGNPIHDAPGGRVVEFQQPVEMVHIDHSWARWIGGGLPYRWTGELDR